MRRSLSIMSAVAGVGLLSGVALAGHTEPAKASKAQFALVNSFDPCFSPNTTVNASGGSACTPATPTGFGDCTLTATGSGQLKLTVVGDPAKGTQVIKVSASAKGLNALCENNQLCLVLSWRATNDDCPEGSCTAEDFDNFDPFGACCTVTGGTCKISTTLNAGTLILANGKNTGLELLGCGLKTSLPLLGEPVLSCGLLFK